MSISVTTSLGCGRIGDDERDLTLELVCEERYLVNLTGCVVIIAYTVWLPIKWTIIFMRAAFALMS